MRIKDIEFPAYYETLDKNNGNLDVFVKMTDGMTYTMVVTTPNNYYWYMDKEGLDYIPAAPPDIIVRTLTKENIWKAIESFAEDNGYWLKLYFLAGKVEGVFDNNKMNKMIEKIKKEVDELKDL
ncbi:hypothetical protein J5Y03_16995 [Bacillus sp. RG28]|uniref:Uncharacterized protein n=1 Tax=Gottfriedia endophytica TaxID=2820819 RepID=A0A940SKV9_9BACI|nr:hypothetical protein [Gottfriedia endophytica]MBP0726856.1 hypothetical protein [Gottfriedia endophytica]